jgi:hypothetical protein
MEPTKQQLVCPECGKTLRPAKPLAPGKSVKCPKCEAVFDVPAADKEDKAAVTGSVREKSPPSGDKEAKGKKAEKKAKKTDDGKPSKTIGETIPLAGDEDGPATYGFIDDHSKVDEPEIDYVPDTSIKDLRGPAQALVVRPSNYMILMGVITTLNFVLTLAIILVPIIFPIPAPANVDGTPTLKFKQEKKVYDASLWLSGSVATTLQKIDTKKKDEDVGSMFMILSWDMMDVPDYPWWEIILLCMPPLIGIAVNAVAILGAVKMQKLESRIWGIVASVLTMLPIAALGSFLIGSMVLTAVLGLLFDLDFVLWFIILWALIIFGAHVGLGIWGIVTLMSQEVIDGYEYVAD